MQAVSERREDDFWGYVWCATAAQSFHQVRVSEDKQQKEKRKEKKSST